MNSESLDLAMQYLKNKLQDLAVFGGSPAFDSILHVGRPNVGDRQRFLELMNDMLDRR